MTACAEKPELLRLELSMDFSMPATFLKSENASNESKGTRRRGAHRASRRALLVRQPLHDLSNRLSRRELACEEFTATRRHPGVGVDLSEQHLRHFT